MRKRLISTSVFISVCLLAVMLLTAGKPDPVVLTILRTEMDRISEAMTSLRRKAPVQAPAPRPTADNCGAAGDRLVKVSSTKDLEQALANASPGDHIHMEDGVYKGAFVIERSGSESQPITLCGSRGAILDGGSIQGGYGVHLRGSYWHLHGFTVRNARKGIMADGAKNNVLQGLEVHRTGDEGVHFRMFSQNNVLRDSWIHDAGVDTPLYGEGVYIGSAISNWGSYSHGKPDQCDGNQVIGNVLGPDVRAEGVDAKEGTRGGVISGNVFMGRGAIAADSWVDMKGSEYRIENNTGTYDPKRPWRGPISVFPSSGGWGEGNVIGPQDAVPTGSEDSGHPYRLSKGRGNVTLVLPRRMLPYRLPELAVCFPQTIETVRPGVYTLQEHIVAGPGTHLAIRRDDVQELRLRSEKRSLATIVGVRNLITIKGSSAGRVWVHSWDPKTQAPDKQSRDGRSFVATVTGRMDIDLGEFTDLGCGTGWASGVAWKGRPDQKCTGNVSRSRFEHNYFGAYTFEADSMRWTDNVFANNDIYGFDPHDNSDYFVVTGNQAFGHSRHGIIFSRGCRGNIIRRNASFSNAGHGLMLDDGKVADDGNPRHFASIPPMGNILEENEVWGNEVGIALQGALDNVVRSNRVRDNRFGMRLDGSDRNTISANKMIRSAEFAMHLLGGSDSNRIVGNQIQGGQGGIVTLDSRHNLIRDNMISGIVGQGIRVAGRAGRTVLLRNRIYGRGSQAIDMRQARTPTALDNRQNATNGWMYPREQLPALLLWGTILGVPMLSSILARMRRSPRRRPNVSPGVGILVLAFLLAGTGTARADGQRLSLTASFSAVHDDNVFKYSDGQLRDISARTDAFRYGIREASDVIVTPGLALTWENDMGVHRRTIRVRGDGALYRTNAGANFGEVDVTWREYFENPRRVSFSYGYSPDHLLRKLYEADLTSLPPNERYRDARYDAHGGFAAWRYEVPFASWLEWAYRFDRRTYERAFRERDSDFHTIGATLGWEDPQGAAWVQASGSHLWRLARKEDGDPGLEGDLSYHGPELGLQGRVGLSNLPSGWLYGDAGYTIEGRYHDARRPTDTANYHRNDLVQSIELGLGLQSMRAWGARAYYRFGWCRADLSSSAPLDSELGSYDQGQFGVVLEWTSQVSNRPLVTGGGSGRPMPDAP